MIESLSSNRSLVASAAVAVASSVVLAIFLSRMGWNGAIKTYPVAMYSWMSVGGASFVLLCVTSARKKAPPIEVRPIPNPDLVRLQEVTAYLKKPMGNQDNIFTVLSELPKGVVEFVLAYAFFPIEKIFIKLRMGIPLDETDPQFELIQEALATYAKSEGGSVRQVLDCINERYFHAGDAYKLLRGFAKYLNCHTDPSSCEDEQIRQAAMYEIKIFGVITTLLLHHFVDERDQVPYDAVEELNVIDGQTYWLSNPNGPIRVLTMANEQEGMVLYLRLLPSYCVNLLQGPMERLATEETALIILEEFFAKPFASRHRAKLCPLHAVQKGWVKFLKRLFELNGIELDHQKIWSTLISGRVLQMPIAARVHPQYNKLQYEYILKANYVAVAIILLKQSVSVPERLDDHGAVSVSQMAIDYDLTDLQDLFTFLGTKDNKPFFGCLEPERFAALDEWAAARGIMPSS